MAHIQNSTSAETLHRFDLPPSQVAKPLPTSAAPKTNGPQPKGKQQPKGKPQTKGNDRTDKKKLKRKRDGVEQNDAPRAFKRLMAFAGGNKPRSGLDDGTPAPKNKKSGKTAEIDAGSEGKEAVPSIRPGERMSEFATRVDAAFPLSGLITKTTKDKDPLGLKVWRTKKERKMHKLYDQWREEDKKVQEKREEELELAEEREMDDEALGVKWRMDLEDAMSKNKKKKKGAKRGKYVGETAGAEEDPWEELKRKRGEPKIGLHDVASAPPELKPVMAKFTVRGATVDVQDIPKSAGSLRRREELQGVRNDVVAEYRKIMEGRRSSRAKKVEKK